MIEEKLQLRQRIIGIGVWVEIFFRTTTNKTTGAIEYYSYPKFKGVLEEIQTELDMCLGHTLMIISDDVNLIDSCQEEISVFYFSLLERYYNNYKREPPKDVFEFNESALSVKGSDLNKSTYKQNFYFNEYKLILFDMLMIYKSKFEEIFSKAISYGQLETGNDITERGILKNISLNPISFEEIFNTVDWQKYIDVLKSTDPPILDNNLNFLLKKKGGNGVLTSWICALMDNGKFNPKFRLPQIIAVFNNEIKNLELGKDGRSAYDISKAYNEKYKFQLEKIL